MRYRLFSSLAVAISLVSVACSSSPSISPGEKYFTDAKDSLKNSDFKAALSNLDGAIKAGGDESPGQQAAVLRVALVVALADASKQMAEAYGAGAKEPPAQLHSGAFSKMRSDYYGIARTRLMDAMQSVMNQRRTLNDKPLSIEIPFPGFTGGADPYLTKIKSGQWASDSERLSAETQADRNALASTLSALAGAGQDSSKGQQIFSSGKVEIDPRVYLMELTSTFLRIGDMFGPKALNEADHVRTVNEVVRGNLEVERKLLAAKPDKDLEARAKKMKADCDKTLKKFGL